MVRMRLRAKVKAMINESWVNEGLIKSIVDRIRGFVMKACLRQIVHEQVILKAKRDLRKVCKEMKSY